MEIEKALELKSEMEKKINDAVNSFQEETNMKVTNIEISNYPLSQSTHAWYSLCIIATVEI